MCTADGCQMESQLLWGTIHTFIHDVQRPCKVEGGRRVKFVTRLLGNAHGNFDDVLLPFVLFV